MSRVAVTASHDSNRRRHISFTRRHALSRRDGSDAGDGRAGRQARAARAAIGRSRDVYTGAIVAIVASLVLAWAVNHLISDDASDTLEGVFQVLAAATLFYVSSWLTSKGQADRWQAFISNKLASAERSTLPAVALGLTAFLAVMREGAETIVFFQALTSGATEAAERHAVAAGVVAAVAALAVAFMLIQRATNLISIGSLFCATSVLLYALAVVFIGQGVASLQEASVDRPHSSATCRQFRCSVSIRPCSRSARKDSC